MFKELVPILRNRAVLMTATALDDDQIRVNVVPKKIKDGDHDAPKATTLPRPASRSRSWAKSAAPTRRSFGLKGAI